MDSIFHLDMKNHMDMLGKPFQVDVTHSVQDGAALFTTKEGENKPQPNGQDEGWFICVGLGCAEAAAFGVLQQKQTHYTRQLYHPRTSYKSCSNQEHLR